MGRSKRVEVETSENQSLDAEAEVGLYEDGDKRWRFGGEVIGGGGRRGGEVNAVVEPKVTVFRVELVLNLEIEELHSFAMTACCNRLGDKLHNRRERLMRGAAFREFQSFCLRCSSC